MSFAVWRSKPPFVFGENDREQIYQVGAVWVVTDDPARATQAAVDAVLNAPLLDISDIDNLDKTLKAIVLLNRAYANALKKGTYAGSAADGTKTVADTKADFRTVYQALP